MTEKLLPCLLFYLGTLASPVQPPRAAWPLPPESIAYRRTQLAANDLQQTDKLSQYSTYDFSPLWLQTTNQAVVGFIGPAYQRLRLKLLTARRDKENPTRYYLTGKARVAGHISTFSGTLVLRQVRELRKLATHTDEAVSPAQQEGIMLADYELREDASQPSAGVFRGVVETDWYISKRGHLTYDDMRTTGDGFCNNQFVGTWTSYATKKNLRCNWGDYRIPNSGDFDMGAGEFGPADKYLAVGWQDVRDCTFGREDAGPSAAACKREAQIWWK